MKAMRALVALVFLCSTIAFGADRTFSVPFADLGTWAESIVVQLDNVTIEGHSGVHKVESDCEMHFGASVQGYTGDPAGWVLEPMNVCVKPFFNKPKHSNSDWTAFGKTLVNKKVSVQGVPRIWPEHLVGEESLSNPNHAMELHPLTQIKSGSKTFDFTKFIFAPEGFRGGLSQATAEKILEKLKVEVTRNGNEVEIEFHAGRIGNFTVFDLRISRDKIESQSTGQRIGAEVVDQDGGTTPVTLVTVKGTDIHAQFERFRTGRRATARLDGLVLFSLDPSALHAAAKTSAGNSVNVENPLQLILYGSVETE
jgi:hypothetical protein